MTTNQTSQNCSVNKQNECINNTLKQTKRKHGEDDNNYEHTSKYIKSDNNENFKKSDSYANLIANHYNLIEDKGISERCKSRIVYLRNFHNWIKSMLINEYLTKVKNNKKYREPVRVLDMCCGKGGDLLKWRKGGISHLICSDIASVSLDQCKIRYEDLQKRTKHGENLFTMEYIPADCSLIRLREKYKDPSMKLDLVSCQFAFHYSFESLPQAECMLRNASECLQPGGYFIGTLPDAYEIIARARRNDNTKIFGNNLYEVSLEFDLNKPPLFGSKYNFQLDGVVDCPEFLVYFPMFVKLAKKFGLKFVKKAKFYEYYEEMKEEGQRLINNMKGLETYSRDRKDSLGIEKDDYKHADTFLSDKEDDVKIGTLSKSEWEASSLYMIFVFQKMKHTWNKDGTPIYIDS